MKGVNWFRNGEYTYTGGTIRLENVTIQDGGYYYCKVKDRDGNVQAASVLLQVTILFYEAHLYIYLDYSK